MNSVSVVFLIALAAPAFGAWSSAPAPANIVLSQDGRNVLETPEVAQARAAHLAALNQAQSVGGNSNDDGSYDSRWEAESQYNPNSYNAPAQNQWNAAPAQQWSGAPAQQWSGAPAQQQWNSAPAQPQWNSAPAQQQWNAPAQNKWQQQPANIALSKDGQYVLDTPEVAQARAAHLAAFSAAQSSAPAPSHNSGQQWNSAPAQQWNSAPAQPQWNSAPAQPQWNSAPAQNQWNAAPAQQWNAAPAQSWNHAGGAPAPVADTPEVAQARAAHLAAHAAAGAHAAPAPARHW